MISALDGCTGVPDVIAGISIRHCCDAHDEALFDSFDMSVFDQANVAFAHCVWDAGLWWLALPALFVVSTAGWLLYRFGPKRKADAQT
ncbi:MAG: hypothetical protein KIS86_17110 [Devosia sp.]|nr:hypothetical protein [Devosia sp.]